MVLEVIDKVPETVRERLDAAVGTPHRVFLFLCDYVAD